MKIEFEIEGLNDPADAWDIPQNEFEAMLKLTVDELLKGKHCRITCPEGYGQERMNLLRKRMTKRMRLLFYDKWARTNMDIKDRRIFFHLEPKPDYDKINS